LHSADAPSVLVPVTLDKPHSPDTAGHPRSTTCQTALLQRWIQAEGSAYLRLSTRPVDRALADVPADPAARERRRRNVVAGAYLLRRAAHPAVTICTTGTLVTEAVQAADWLDTVGFPADVSSHQPGPAVRRDAGPPGGSSPGRTGSSTSSSQVTGRLPWSPSSTATPTPWRSWPVSTGLCRPISVLASSGSARPRKCLPAPEHRYRSDHRCRAGPSAVLLRAVGAVDEDRSRARGRLNAH